MADKIYCLVRCICIVNRPTFIFIFHLKYHFVLALPDSSAQILPPSNWASISERNTLNSHPLISCPRHYRILRNNLVPRRGLRAAYQRRIHIHLPLLDGHELTGLDRVVRGMQLRRLLQIQMRHRDRFQPNP